MERNKGTSACDMMEMKNMSTNKKSFSELIIELIELTQTFFRQELKSTIDNIVVGPLKKVGFWLALTLVAATLFSLALIFLAVGAFQLLATLVGATWMAYLIIGVVLFLVAGLLLILRPGGGVRGKKRSDA